MNNVKIANLICYIFVAVGVLTSPMVVSAKPTGKSKVASSYLIVPGVRVGAVRIGMRRNEVRQVLGAPKYVSYGRDWESYREMLLRYSGERVEVIEVESPKYKTADGLSVKSQLKNIKKRHPKMTIVREDPFEMWTFSYNDRPKGIGFCFECSRNFDDSVKDWKIRPSEEQHPAKIGIYPRGKNWKGFYSSE